MNGHVSKAGILRAFFCVATLGILNAEAQQQVAKLTASDAAASKNFGVSSAIRGDTIVIGALSDSETAMFSGAAYVFRDNGGNWQQIAKLKADDAEAFDFLGASVAISGDTIVAGAQYDDDLANDGGAAYIFREIDGTWQQIAKIAADDAAASDQFGVAVSISGDTVVVGADWDDEAGQDSGSVYVFREIGGVWQQIDKLVPADGEPGDQFGVSVSISGDTAAIGANLDDEEIIDSGAVYVYREVGGIWTEIAKLTRGDAAEGDGLGYPVAIDGDTLVAGAQYDDGIGVDSGSAHVYREIGGVWEYVIRLTASDAAAGEQFGISVSISANKVLVGKPGDGNGGQYSGAAYVFAEAGELWPQFAKLTADDASAGDFLGVSAAIDGTIAVVGAMGDANQGENTGAAYVFALDFPCDGDLDGDLDVDLSDLAQLLSNYGLTSGATYEDGDLDGDGDVDISDLAALLSNYGESC